MRRATLYTAKQEEVTVYSDIIPYHIMSPMLTRMTDSGEFIIRDHKEEIHHLPIEQWAMDGSRHFFAFDPKLRDIIQTKIHTEVYAVRKELRSVIEDLHSENLQLQSRTIWDMICSKFKRNVK